MIFTKTSSTDMLRWRFRQSESLKRWQRKITMVLVWDQFTPLWYIYIYTVYIYICIYSVYICTVFLDIMYLSYSSIISWHWISQIPWIIEGRSQDLQQRNCKDPPQNFIPCMVSSSPSRGKGMENLSFFRRGYITIIKQKLGEGGVIRIATCSFCGTPKVVSPNPSRRANWSWIASPLRIRSRLPIGSVSSKMSPMRRPRCLTSRSTLSMACSFAWRPSQISGRRLLTGQGFIHQWTGGSECFPSFQSSRIFQILNLWSTSPPTFATMLVRCFRYQLEVSIDISRSDRWSCKLLKPTLLGWFFSVLDDFSKKYQVDNNPYLMTLMLLQSCTAYSHSHFHFKR